MSLDAIPPARSYRDSYGAAKLAIGGSVFAPFVGATVRENIAAAVYIHARRYGKKFQIRKVREGGVEGVRVWRVG